MRSSEAHAESDATPDRIWSILVDGAHYPDRGSGGLNLDGPIESGQTIEVVSSANAAGEPR